MSLLRHAALAVLLCSAAARAQSAAPTEAGSAPAPQTGFQMALRTGYGLPFGNSSGAPGDTYKGLVSGQVPVMLDIGGKLSHHVFLGGYLGLGFGGVGSELKGICATPDVTCVHASFRLGAQLQYNFAPAAKANPWLGYGIGIESTGVGASGPAGDTTMTAVGWELARLMAGVDFRLSHAVGIGPFADFSVGRYSRVTLKEASGSETSGDLQDKAAHEWLTLGVRFVLFP
ncbi:autotransporter outer membrane beta-barrel domain-containing protein [Aggregicoccus sp. 17bor-14]|uniref:hypothetical protein n=1 Tax=Myxococcaceae TaxID=31 RepID=UPI00129C4149|nr:MULTISPECIES: hypothetical protein [Myxococcaceae]MBF5045138.1 hypothetical protein [Simulacricoccus sp. 17bor-14]MRI90880.1 autotransporter outer membrane beta-barrel domain-containing protein [Aggregicoccus sp. 17bor-14]